GKTVLADERGGLFKPRVNRTAALRSRAERGEKDERQREGKPPHAAAPAATIEPHRRCAVSSAVHRVHLTSHHHLSPRRVLNSFCSTKPLPSLTVRILF